MQIYESIFICTNQHSFSSLCAARGLYAGTLTLAQTAETAIENSPVIRTEIFAADKRPDLLDAAALKAGAVRFRPIVLTPIAIQLHCCMYLKIAGTEHVINKK